MYFTFQMGISFLVSLFSLTLLLSSVSSEQEANHHNHHHHDDKWPYILSQIEFLWKNKSSSLTTVETSESNKSEGQHVSQHAFEHSTTEVSTTATIQNGTILDNIKEGFRISLAMIIGIPIVGVIFLVCCCYCLCKCCCSTDETEGKVIVLQQTNNGRPVEAPQHTQVILQQPIYQTPPPYAMQQPTPHWTQAQPQQWATSTQQYQPQEYQQPQQHFPAVYDNPNYGSSPSAPPQYDQKY